MHKIQENRFRRMADRQGYILRKSPRRDSQAIDFGLYALCHVETGGTVHPEGPISPYSLADEDVREWLEGGKT